MVYHYSLVEGRYIISRRSMPTIWGQLCHKYAHIFEVSGMEFLVRLKVTQLWVEYFTKATTFGWVEGSRLKLGHALKTAWPRKVSFFSFRTQYLTLDFRLLTPLPNQFWSRMKILIGRKKKSTWCVVPTMWFPSQIVRLIHQIQSLTRLDLAKPRFV